jgi:hypothetical protein
MLQADNYNVAYFRHTILFFGKAGRVPTTIPTQGHVKFHIVAPPVTRRSAPIRYHTAKLKTVTFTWHEL